VAAFHEIPTVQSSLDRLLGRASDKRAIQTYEDAETILVEAAKIQEHLQAQDVILEQLITRMEEALK